MAEDINAWLGVAWQAALVVGVVVGVVIQILTFRKIHVVIEQTNGMSHRLEEFAEQRGREKEKAEERRDHDA